MNKILSYLSLISLSILVSCSQAPTTSIDIVLNENSKVSKLFLIRNIDNAWHKIDSALVENGSVQLNYNGSATDYVTISQGDLKGFGLIVTPGESQSVVFENFPNEFDEKQSQLGQESALLYQFLGEGKMIDQEALNLRSDVQNQVITKEEYTAEINKLRARSIENAKQLIEKNPNSPVCLSALQVISPKEDMATFKSVAKSLETVMGNSGYLANLNKTIVQIEEQAKMEALQREQQEAMAAKLAIGKEAPEIALNDPNGQLQKLSDLKGKYVLIDFWASWCKPCRRENPNVVRLYNKYKNKGFEVFSVSLDRNEQAWKNAIMADNLTWTHVSDLKFWNSAAAQLYGVNAIPKTFLLDKEGKILAKDLRGKALENKLAELFAS